MTQPLTGDQIRRIRQAFGLPIDRFARVLGVHPVTLNRWELEGAAVPKVEGMARNVLIGLQDRLILGSGPKRPLRNEARNTGLKIEHILAVGGILLALAVLLEFANAKRR